MSSPLVPFPYSHEHPGSEITGDLFEFVRAIEAYQRRYRVRYPAWSEVLYVLRTLGYAKVVPGADYGSVQTGAADDADKTADEEEQKKSLV